MAIYANRTRFKKLWPFWRLILIGLNTLAIVLSAILSYHYLSGEYMPGCGGGSPCDQVLNSQWSLIAGILPISGLAIGVYLTMFIASFYMFSNTELSIRLIALKAMLILSGAIIGSALWFTFVQNSYIKSFCPFCMTTHIAGTLIAIIVFWRATKKIDILSKASASSNHNLSSKYSFSAQSRIIHPLRALGLVFIGLLLAGMVAGFQLNYTPSSVYQNIETQDSLSVIDYKTAPMLGSYDAPYVVLVLFDYQCSHCQKIHFMLDEIVRRYEGKLAFALCPVPLNTKCNPYIPRDIDAFKNSCELAKIGLAVWFANREKFRDFEQWMFSYESGSYWRPRSLDAATQKANEVVGQVALNAALSDPWVEDYLKRCVQLFGQTMQSGKGGIPKLVFGSRWVIPEPNSIDDLIVILQNSLALPDF